MSGSNEPRVRDPRTSVGIHVSISKSIDLAVDRALEIGCVGTFQIFTCSPRRWAAPELDPAQAGRFRHNITVHNFTPFVHMPYMPNLASPEDDFYKQSVEVLIREARRCNNLGVGSLVLHFGSHLGSSIDQGHERVIGACKKAILETQDSGVRLLLETSAGARNSVGSRFEFVKKVLDGVGNEGRTGVCFDTCHVFASGYDLRSEEAVKKTLD
ncbi:MAG: deoxyribonuclease IV, partial [Nitrososphaerales archaeon]